MSKKVMRKSPEVTEQIRTGAAYIRVSTDDQLEYSPESQLEEIKRYCLQHNILLPSEFIFVERKDAPAVNPVTVMLPEYDCNGEDQAEALRCHCTVEIQPFRKKSG